MALGTALGLGLRGRLGLALGAGRPLRPAGRRRSLDPARRDHGRCRAGRRARRPAGVALPMRCCSPRRSRCSRTRARPRTPAGSSASLRWSRSRWARGARDGCCASAAFRRARRRRDGDDGRGHDRTAPLIALHFGRASLVGLPANVLAAPAVAPAMWLGALAAAVGQVSSALAAPLAALAALPTAYLAWLGHAAAHLPGANARLPLGVVIALCGAAAARVVLPRRRRRWGPRRAVPALVLLVPVLLAVAAVAHRRAAAPPPALRISFLDVGQGDATLIQAGGRAVLVDAGPLGDHVAALVRHEGARRLDLLVITHAQADHEGGAAEVLSQLPVTAVLDGRDGVASPDGTRLEAAARARRVRLLRPSAGQILHAGPIRLDVLSPPRDGRIPGADPNARAIVLEAAPAASGRSSPPTRSRTFSRPCRCGRSTCSRSPTTAAPIRACRRSSASCARAPRSSRSAATTRTATRLPQPSAPSAPAPAASFAPTTTARSASNCARAAWSSRPMRNATPGSGFLCHIGMRQRKT